MCGDLENGKVFVVHEPWSSGCTIPHRRSALLPRFSTTWKYHHWLRHASALQVFKSSHISHVYQESYFWVLQYIVPIWDAGSRTTFCFYYCCCCWLRLWINFTVAHTHTPLFLFLKTLYLCCTPCSAHLLCYTHSPYHTCEPLVWSIYAVIMIWWMSAVRLMVVLRHQQAQRPWWWFSFPSVERWGDHAAHHPH